MTLLQFMNSKKDEETAVGDLVRDALTDKEFKSRKTDAERLSYLEFASRYLSGVYEEFIEEFYTLNNNV